MLQTLHEKFSGLIAKIVLGIVVVIFGGFFGIQGYFNQRTETFVATTGLDRIGTPNKPLDRFNIVTARIANPEPGGLQIDNSRHVVVEVQERLSPQESPGVVGLESRPANLEEIYIGYMRRRRPESGPSPRAAAQVA